MKIDGRLIASEIKENLKSYILNLKSRKIIPHLAVVLVGSDPGSKAYVNQKIIVGKDLGVKVSLFSPSQLDQLVKLVQSLNSDPSVHGIIIQRPTPLLISNSQLDQLVQSGKDVDGFHPHSPFTPPIALAVLKILSHVFQLDQLDKLAKSLSSKSLLIIGRGETGGKPIANTFKKLHIPYTVAHSKTENLERLTKSADIIISCVGKPNIVRRQMLSKKAILIGVGMHADAASRLKGDYEEDEVKDTVSLYTPIPGGVGPVNVACLFENLIKATKL